MHRNFCVFQIFPVVEFIRGSNDLESRTENCHSTHGIHRLSMNTGEVQAICVEKFTVCTPKPRSYDVPEMLSSGAFNRPVWGVVPTELRSTMWVATHARSRRSKKNVATPEKGGELCLANFGAKI